MNCIFCKIIAGQAAGSFVLQEELVVAFMDINQPNPYKVLVIPRLHVENIYDLSPEQGAAVMYASQRIAQVIWVVARCAGWKRL